LKKNLLDRGKAKGKRKRKERKGGSTLDQSNTEGEDGVTDSGNSTGASKGGTDLLRAKKLDIPEKKGRTASGRCHSKVKNPVLDGGENGKWLGRRKSCVSLIMYINEI